jgi:phage anti-repressor protein
VVINHIPQNIISKKNSVRSWIYGYNDQYDVVVISKTGQIGEIINISGLNIALPPAPEKCYKRNDKTSEQNWYRMPIPRELEKIQSIFQWNDKPMEFKNRWVDYIEQEFDYREQGYWFMNKGKPCYITGSHYMYLQWSSIDVGYPDFREANRIFFLFWEACKADERSFGMIYLKIRRSGFSFMSSSECVNLATLARDSRLGILSKTGADAKKMFTDKVVPINNKLPFFFKPIMDGMDKPKTELAFRVPASKITKKNMHEVGDNDIMGLDTTIDWKNTEENSYDGEKLLFLAHDECYAPETKILMEDFSFRQIKDINIGDKVIVDGGKIKTVVKKTSGETDRYIVKQPYGEDYIVTKNHRLVFNEYKKGEVIMNPEEYINSSKFRKQHLTRIVSKGIQAEDCFNGIPPYLLGLWLGDGRQSSFTILVNKEEEPEILAYLGRLAQIKNIDFDLRKSTCNKIVEFAFKGINKSLRDIGVYNNKHIPDEYIKSSIECRLQLLAGIIETDGHSDKKKNIISIGMSREKLIEQIRFLALSCGLSCSNIKCKNTNFGAKSYNISISGDLSIIPLITKKKSFEGYSPKTRGRRNKVSVEYLDNGDYVGIQVDAENDDERRLILGDFTVSMNSGKWIKPNNILNNWRVTKTCLRLGSKIIGKCMMGSTSNALNKGGDNFKKLYEDSNVMSRNANGQTKSGLYALFIPMEWNMEGFIDKYGMPVHRKPEEPIEGVDGALVKNGAIDYWENEVDSLKNDADALNEFYRQFPRTESHAFRDESKQALFNLTKIYQQIDYNDSLMMQHYTTRGSFSWKDGIKDTRVIFTPNRTGRFLVTWMPPAHYQNNVHSRNGVFYPGNEHLGSFGCDPYDISAVVGGRGSNGSLHGMTKFHMDDAPANEFFLEYIARPQTAEIFFEEVLMACVFYGMPILIENNKPRLLYHFKNRGYRGFCMNRPDKPINKLTKTEKEIGGIPNSSEDVKQSHASAIESYIEKYIGLDMTGTYRSPDEMGTMYFTRTLEDWAKFDINDRTKFDACISSGLAIMANQKHLYMPEKKESKIIINFARYSNDGTTSQLIR